MIPAFYGDENDIEAWGWLLGLEQHFQANQIPEDERLKEAVKGLRGQALCWYIIWSGLSSQVSWRSFDKAFIGRYIPEIWVVEEDEISNNPEKRKEEKEEIYQKNKEEGDDDVVAEEEKKRDAEKKEEKEREEDDIEEATEEDEVEPKEGEGKINEDDGEEATADVDADQGIEEKERIAVTEAEKKEEKREKEEEKKREKEVQDDEERSKVEGEDVVRSGTNRETAREQWQRPRTVAGAAAQGAQAIDLGKNRSEEEIKKVKEKEGDKEEEEEGEMQHRQQQQKLKEITICVSKVAKMASGVFVKGSKNLPLKLLRGREEGRAELALQELGQLLDLMGPAQKKGRRAFVLWAERLSHENTIGLDLFQRKARENGVLFFKQWDPGGSFFPLTVLFLHLEDKVNFERGVLMGLS